eukprot:SAG31_NODE_1048_length_10166_cov_4.708751_2_plen_69_part_00
MVVSVKAELESLREGLHDVIPPEELSDLTADDLQVLYHKHRVKTVSNVSALTMHSLLRCPYCPCCVHS